MANAPIIVPTTHSHLINTTKPKPGLTVNLSTQAVIPKAVPHLSQLTIEADAPLENSSKPSTDTTVTLEPQPMYEDSNVDLETGEVLVPMKISTGPNKFAYKLKPNSADYKPFT